MNLDINQWIKNLINKFREEYQNLSNEGRKKIQRIDDLNPPCQIDVFWIESTIHRVGFQALFISHWEDLADLDITIYGPFEPQDCIEKLEEIFKTGKWDRKLPESGSRFLFNGEKKYSNLVESFMVGYIQSFKDSIQGIIFSKSGATPHSMRKSLIAEKVTSWLHWGRIQETEIGKTINEIMENAKRIIYQEPKTDIKAEKSSIKGFGTYFYPPLWVGDVPQLSFREKVTEEPLTKYAETIISTKYKGKVLIVNKDGYIAIGDEDKRKVLELLNEIMATALLLNIPSTIIREHEIGETHIDRDKLKIISAGLYLVSMRTRLFEESLTPISTTLFPLNRKLVSKEKFIEIINKAEKLTNDEELGNFLYYLLESYTHLNDHEFSQSFIMSWIIIEKILAIRWKRLIYERGIKGKRMNKLNNPIAWTADHILETLNFASKFTDNDYIIILNLKEIRNKIIHKNVKCSKDEADKCLKISLNLVNAMIAEKVLGELQ